MSCLVMEDRNCSVGDRVVPTRSPSDGRCRPNGGTGSVQEVSGAASSPRGCRCLLLHIVCRDESNLSYANSAATEVRIARSTPSGDDPNFECSYNTVVRSCENGPPRSNSVENAAR